ncbi:MAG: ankyrin repeat domain-containing protein [Noviherbaspirillum sp.]
MTTGPAMNDAHLTAALEPLYRRAGGKRAAGIDEMLQRIADDSSRLLRVQAFPAGFEAIVLDALRRHGAQMDGELRIDLLALACEAGYAELAAALLTQGIAWREGDAYQCMALAIQARQPALVRLLLEAGISAASCGACGTPLLSHAISAGDADIVRLLRTAGARADNEGAALAAAAISGRLDMISMCVEDGVSTAALGDALDHAAAAGHHEAVRLLLQRGAPVDPALLHATQRGDTEMAELICAGKAAQLLASRTCGKTVAADPAIYQTSGKR